ncbi:unnamed protein product [Paramecium pentaurelia]|uniref:Uncharacterized protein n=1 Tax=Paramecium pentaurelia TaxID=43138 RepID=A0A8S1UJI1_9CILI|nr:unnamed protein product [Paramecium pentaurelia]CAD8164617.1 unnamed protein product [Paramecium pentaurelia]
MIYEIKCYSDKQIIFQYCSFPKEQMENKLKETATQGKNRMRGIRKIKKKRKKKNKENTERLRKLKNQHYLEKKKKYYKNEGQNMKFK